MDLVNAENPVGLLNLIEEQYSGSGVALMLCRLSLLVQISTQKMLLSFQAVFKVQN